MPLCALPQIHNFLQFLAQVLLNLFAVVAISFAARPLNAVSGKAISLVLAIFWLWVGLVYHLAFFSSLNSGAFLFSILSVAGSLVFIWEGVIHDRLKFRFAWEPRTFLGASLMLFALFVYPLWLYFSGHRYPASPTFGLPCPTTIFTIGILALFVRPVPLKVFIVPIIWSIIGVQAAFLLNVWPDLILGMTGVIGILLVSREWFERHLNNWGSTYNERSLHFAGEEFLRKPKIKSTHAITINSEAENVWPWLLQMGQGRGGFYSYSWLENLVGCKIQNAQTIIPQLQNLKQGDSIALHPRAPPLKVTVLEVNKTLALEGWVFALHPLKNHRTRLISRIYTEKKPEMGCIYNFLMTSILFDLVHFVMSRKQLLRIKELCEQSESATILFSLRRRFGRLRTSRDETNRVMAGDAFISHPTHSATQAITVNTAPADIWPWLVQMGYQRGGLYSYDWLDRLFGFLDQSSAKRVLPEFQHLAIGDKISLGPRQQLTVAALVPARELVLRDQSRGMEWVWQFALYPIKGNRTRLVTRGTERIPKTVGAWLFMLVMKPAAFIMTRRMLLGLRERAETLYAPIISEVAT